LLCFLPAPLKIVTAGIPTQFRPAGTQTIILHMISTAAPPSTQNRHHDQLHRSIPINHSKVNCDLYLHSCASRPRWQRCIATKVSCTTTCSEEHQQSNASYQHTPRRHHLHNAHKYLHNITSSHPPRRGSDLIQQAKKTALEESGNIRSALQVTSRGHDQAHGTAQKPAAAPSQALPSHALE
jgi:hypothetical protein